jgi:hypothetical protein
MSGKADQERAARGEIFRNGMKIHIAPGETLRRNLPRGMVFKCGKCGGIYSEDMEPGHLALCQPDGSICGHCMKKFPAHEIISHMKVCGTKPPIKLIQGSVIT